MISKYIQFVLLILILITQAVSYFIKNEFNIFLIAFVCFLAPSAIKKINLDNDNTIIHNIFLFIGLLILLLGLYRMFI